MRFLSEPYKELSKLSSIPSVGTLGSLPKTEKIRSVAVGLCD
jgi:hypothetical protein